MPEVDTRDDGGPDWLRGTPEPEVTAALSIAWSLREPRRVGEVAFVGGRTMLGRGEASGSRVRFLRSRPGREEDRGPLVAPSISRDHVAIEPDGDDLRVRCVGRVPMRVDGRPCVDGVLRPGSTLELHNELVLLHTRRVRTLDVRDPGDVHPFGEPDAAGVVGEGPRSWALRDAIAFAAGQDEHVLITGPSGSGKELVAGAVHAQGSRSSRVFVARNAATLPEGIVDAELFGHARGYPNAGMPERDGLIGLAHGGTLFLDEIGSLPPELQAHLLRVLDRGGEYTRLGDSRPRRADLRVLAATNADVADLKPDFGARFRLRLAVPSLAERLEDVPLLVRHLVGRAARDPAIRDRFVGDDGEARIAPALIVALLGHGFPLNVRELDGLLWASMSDATGPFLGLTPAVAARLEVRGSPSPPPARAEPVDADAVRRALEACGGNITASARLLGLPSRYAMYRLMRKVGVSAP